MPRNTFSAEYSISSLRCLGMFCTYVLEVQIRFFTGLTLNFGVFQ